MIKILDNCNNSNVQITTIRLNGDNFLCSSQVFGCIFVDMKRLVILMEKKAPTKNHHSFATWYAENYTVMFVTWLVNSTEEICSNDMCYSNTNELWVIVNHMYSDLDNQSRVFELNLKLGDIRQRGDTITQYYYKLTKIWQDLAFLMIMNENQQTIKSTTRNLWRMVVFTNF